MSQALPATVELDRTTDWPKCLSAVRDHWHSLLDGRDMPRRRDLSPARLKPQLPELLLADVVNGGADFRYRLVGTRLTEYFSGDPTGKPMSVALAPFGDDTMGRTLASYRAVVERRRPLRITGAGSIYGQEPLLFDSWLAPLADEAGAVSTVLCTFVFVWDKDHTFRSPRLPKLAARGGR